MLVLEPQRIHQAQGQGPMDPLLLLHITGIAPAIFTHAADLQGNSTGPPPLEKPHLALKPETKQRLLNCHTYQT